ncbi:hypothetical protein [Amycolatopsis sp. CA-126428]|uniref:hypothetical protein n=1 Tax=Amycolatopsis sp. CA-126428 TaxID=2073158 RepID=UPI0011B0BDD7|nr:hypothetical protein [Amycolatopsis sp. CA-126428]
MLLLMPAVLAIGCNPDPPRPPSTPTSITADPTTPGEVSRPVPPTSAGACAGLFPNTLTLVAENFAEALAQTGLAVCADRGLRVVDVVNNSSTVWIVDRPAGLEPPSATLSVPTDVSLFREIRGGAAGLAVEPGQHAVVEATPAQLHLRLDKSSTLGWQTLTLFKDSAGESRQGKVVDALANLGAKGSPTRKVLITCGRAGYEAADLLLDDPAGHLQEEPTQSLRKSLGLAGKLEKCGVAVKESESWTPELKLGVLAEHAKRLSWTEQTNSLARAAVRAMTVAPRI